MCSHMGRCLLFVLIIGVPLRAPADTPEDDDRTWETAVWMAARSDLLPLNEVILVRYQLGIGGRRNSTMADFTTAIGAGEVVTGTNDYWLAMDWGIQVAGCIPARKGEFFVGGKMSFVLAFVADPMGPGKLPAAWGAGVLGYNLPATDNRPGFRITLEQGMAITMPTFGVNFGINIPWGAKTRPTPFLKVCGNSWSWSAPIKIEGLSTLVRMVVEARG